MEPEYKVRRGQVTIDGVLYKAFEMWGGGQWKVVRGELYSDPVELERIPVKTATAAIQYWLTIGGR
jgi:hypothetical protein